MVIVKAHHVCVKENNMFTIMLAWLEATSSSYFSDLYLGTVIIDVVLIVSVAVNIAQCGS